MSRKPTAGRPVIPQYGIPETLEGILPWDHVEQRMTQAVNYWIASVDEHNRPHATPVWGVWLNGAFYFDGGPHTRRGRNMARNPHIAVHLESGSDVVILHGTARELKSAPLELREQLSAAYSAKYAAQGYAPGPETWEQGGVYTLEPARAFAWTKFPDDTTRWTF